MGIRCSDYSSLRADSFGGGRSGPITKREELKFDKRRKIPLFNFLFKSLFLAQNWLKCDAWAILCRIIDFAREFGKSEISPPVIGQARSGRPRALIQQAPPTRALIDWTRDGPAQGTVRNQQSMTKPGSPTNKFIYFLCRSVFYKRNICLF